jgi:hypothetical protein
MLPLMLGWAGMRPRSPRVGIPAVAASIDVTTVGADTALEERTQWLPEL